LLEPDVQPRAELSLILVGVLTVGSARLIEALPLPRSVAAALLHSVTPTQASQPSQATLPTVSTVINAAQRSDEAAHVGRIGADELTGLACVAVETLLACHLAGARAG
jgi:hypothetical protein